MRKIPELDALRGLAALGVVLYHIYPNTFFAGWSCVDLFFVLSGFLISSVILEHVHDRGFFSAFYYRRALRIWPVYYLTLAVVLLFNASSRHGYSIAGLPWHLVFLQNIQHYWHAPAPSFVYAFSPSWSVAVEEQFYLLWPLALWFVGQRGVVPLACALIVLSVCARSFGLHFDVLVGRFDGLAMGSILAALWRAAGAAEVGRAEQVKRLARGLALVSVPALIVACSACFKFWGDPYPHWPAVIFLTFSLVYFSMVGLAVCLSGHRVLWPLRLKPLRWLGSISYAMYMFHLPILNYAPPLLEHFGLRSTAVQMTLQWIAIFALPILSYHLLEKPILSLKERFRYEGATA